MLSGRIMLKNSDYGCENRAPYNLYCLLEKYSVAAIFFVGVSTPICLIIWLFLNMNEDIRIVEIQEREKRLIDYEKYVMTGSSQKQKEKSKNSIFIDDSSIEQSGSKTSRRSKDKGGQKNYNSNLPMDYYRKKTKNPGRYSKTSSRASQLRESMFSETIIEEEEEEETDVHDNDAYRLNLRNKIKSDGRIVKDTEQENMHRWYRDYHSETSKIKISRGADESEVGDDEEEPPRRNFINLKKAIN